MVEDNYRDLGVDPAIGGEAIDVSSSDQELTWISRAIWVGGDGAIRVLMKDGTTLTFSGIVAGTVMPLAVSTVYQTGTTASNLVAMY